MSNMATVYKLGLALPMVLLTACLGGRYQAPIDDRGEVQAPNAPIITQSTADPVGRGAIIDRTGAGTSTASRSRSGAQAFPAVAQAAIPSPVDSGPSHRVLPGETLYSIAFQYDMDARSLALANGLTPPYTIYASQQLNLDLSRVSRSGSTSLVVNSANPMGTAVSNNSVARAQAGNSGAGGVSRQPIAAGGTQNPEPLWAWPVQGRLIKDFQAGSRGLDIASVQGAPVYAAGSGEVVYSGRGIQGMGDLIIVRHSDRFLSAYGHNSAMLVSEGTRVQGGQKIAEVGLDNDGVPLLHFEIREDGKPVDPLTYLPD